MVIRNFKKVSDLLTPDRLVEPNSKPQFTFELDPEIYNQIDFTKIRPGCDCTSFTYKPNSITFTIQAPNKPFFLSEKEPFLKSVNPKYDSSNLSIEWEIKFYVK